MSESRISPDFPTLRRDAIRFWERGRILYSAILGLTVLATIFLRREIAPAFGDPEPTLTVDRIVAFAIGFVLANIAFSFIYAVEFVVMETKFHHLLRNARKLILALGMMLGIVLSWANTHEIFNR